MQRRYRNGLDNRICFSAYPYSTINPCVLCHADDSVFDFHVSSLGSVPELYLDRNTVPNGNYRTIDCERCQLSWAGFFLPVFCEVPVADRHVRSHNYDASKVILFTNVVMVIKEGKSPSMNCITLQYWMFWAYMHVLFNPFTRKSNQFKISPTASPEILYHTVWRTLLFIAYLYPIHTN